MTTLKPIPGKKGKEQIYYDEILNVYGSEGINFNDGHTPYEALEALKKHTDDKKARKAKVVAKDDALMFKKKGAYSALKLKEVPYDAVKSFYQFSEKPNFVVIGIRGKGIPKQYIVLSAPKADKLSKLFDVLQISQWAPEHKINMPVPPVNTASIVVTGGASESSALQTPSASPAPPPFENSRSATSHSSPALRRQPFDPPTETSRPISSRSTITPSPSPQRQPLRTGTISRTSATSHISEQFVAPRSSCHQCVTRSMSHSSSLSRTKPTPTSTREYTNQRSVSLSRTSSSTTLTPQVPQSITTPTSILVSREQPVEYSETKDQFVVYKPRQGMTTRRKSLELSGLEKRNVNYSSSSSSSDEGEDIKARSVLKKSERSNGGALPYSARRDKQKPKNKSVPEMSRKDVGKLSSKIYYFHVDRENFSSSDSDSDSMAEDAYIIRSASEKPRSHRAPPKRRNRSSSSSSSVSSSSSLDNRKSRPFTIYRIVQY
ncbi:hypothetical protein ECG_01877 [Echinococcus granulosus]|uniref:Expressed conserved protein n=1 Tax=Echinococcus granulosus TaxID=6210 RepID=U6J0D9_ECHGR|nr:hypothetical protein EGR_05991 [Echinococcus granulosus]EUB59128.1 hypothetical protein EGR_05991 [Echinococcus granulosus]KAH9286621.1 hypothetical protein ECG_01877 [Echinococcus granulosus]CDS15165.1 expressed conserved protein [Echinococcus granulosus]